MALVCPSCESHEVRKVSLVYEEGFQKTRTKTIFGGGAISLLGPVFGLGAAYSRGTSQSLLAERLAPPRVPRPFFYAVIAFLVIGIVGLLPPILIGIIFGNIAYHFVVFIWFAALIAYPCYVFIREMALLRGYQKKLSDWNQLFMCNQCGHIFDPSEVSSKSE